MAAHYREGAFPPEQRLDWPQLIPFIGPAAAALARYDGMLSAIPNPRLLLAPLATREAVLSSRIEGTQATMGEVLEFEAGQEPESPERREDIREMLNYRAAMRRADLQEHGLCEDSGYPGANGAPVPSGASEKRHLEGHHPGSGPPGHRFRVPGTPECGRRQRGVLRITDAQQRHLSINSAEERPTRALDGNE